MIVVDASALLEVLLNTSAAVKIAERMFGGHDTLHTPHVLDLELAGLLSGYFFRFFKRVRSSFIDRVDSFRLSSMSFQNLDEV